MKLLKWLTEPNPDSPDAAGRAGIVAGGIVLILVIISAVFS